MKTFITRILVPTDFSRPSERALDYAHDLAEQFGASLHLLHVVNRPLLAEGLAAEAYVSAKFAPMDVRSDLHVSFARLFGDGVAANATTGTASAARTPTINAFRTLGLLW